MSIHYTLRALGWLVSELVPAQAIRVAQDRDYDRAVKRAEGALVEAGAEVDCPEPRIECPPNCDMPGLHLSPDGAYLVQHGYWGSDPQWQMHGPGTFEVTDAATLLDSAASATAAPSPAIPPAGDTDPAPHPPVVPGHSNFELVELIAEVLDAHVYEWFNNGEVSDRCRCGAPGVLGRKQWQRDHVAPLIAERIENATPPVPFTFGDLARAATIIRNYADGFSFGGGQRVAQLELHDLANRLAGAADADPNP